ncbi:ee698df4-0457-4e18-8f18-a4034454f35a [Sclerotinia trifoliorum]|uniref:Ee698df4-0457-4e18-8f18-a4034454f35a n=1 Tax=Sclerotinia trifoliorum TaxID=28548 RepID=A0A8H2W1Q8_9HELO|nr:ee698df4-0457-4e18-8f18-a4034454f35a [Sclerotinia trifoliorum]
MLPTPLTPPYGSSADNIENDSSSGRILPDAPETPHTNHPLSLATPTSNSSMIPNGPNEAYTPGTRSFPEDMMEESDQDMSDGGAPLTTIASHAEELNTAMEAVGSEIMGQYNLVGPHHHPQIQSLTNPFSTQTSLGELDVPSGPGGSSSQHEGDTPLPLLEANSTTDFPAVMSGVLQQLQHIQDGQEHGDFESASDEHHDTFINHNQIDNQFNMNLGDFLSDWATTVPRKVAGQSKRGVPSQAAITSHILARDLMPMRRCDLQGDDCDIQRIDWKDLGVTRLEARQRRRATYKNYTNLIYPNRPLLYPRPIGLRLPNCDNYFKFRRMDFEHDVHIRHFQLRNLISCLSQNCVTYAAKTKVLHYDPTIGSTPRMLMDLGNPRLSAFHTTFNGCQISTLTSGHELVVAGGFEGQYALVNIRAHKDAKHIEGVITEHPNDITNHAQVHLSRSSSTLVTFASNDTGVRTLDVTTNKFISNHYYDHAMNCTAVSPDRRLRVLVGDTRKVMICNSETGQVLQELEGHLDFGFACDWSEDGWMVATGNQDMQVKIWDARYWNRPVASIAADMAGVRKLKFSPLGTGRPILVAAEPADYVNIIDAENFASKQTLSFLGEIGGFDFTNDGQDLVIANCDTLRGGIMEFERCDFATEGLCGKDEQIRFMMSGKKRDFGNTSMADDILEEPLELRGTTKRREKRAALLTDLGLF